MREAGVKARYRKKFKVTTNSDYKQPMFDNVLARDFSAAEPDQVYVGDSNLAGHPRQCNVLLPGLNAKTNSLEPSVYIQHVLERIAEADTLEKLEARLPWSVDLERTSQKCRSSTEDKWVDLRAPTVQR
jgi:hypothetical protein